jgi:ribosomal protein L3 glutamine methyltransferase
MSESFAVQTQHFNTIIDFLRFGMTQANTLNIYYGHGTDNAWNEMLALILGSLSLPPDLDPLLFQSQLTKEEKNLLCEQLEKRLHQRIPVPYLTQEAYFCNLPFYVDERVLIPRSPIAELIEQQFSPWIAAQDVTRILDLCTGSGCIAIACCYAFPEADVDAVDISPAALEVAEINRQAHHLQDNLRLIESDCFTKVPEGQYDIIVSNPPYVGHDEMQTLPLEYSHEPALALEAKKNGLAIVEKILVNAHAYLSDYGILVVEVGNSEDALVEAYPDVPFTWLDFERGGQGVFMLTCQQLKDYFTQ